MSEKFEFDQMIEGKEQHYSNKGFLAKFKGVGSKLGVKGAEAAATLYVALKSPDMPRTNKLIMAGALGYFIMPFDVVADLLPLVGLSDDVFVMTMALTKVFMSITDDMKDEARELVAEKFGSKL
ncbi:MAG: DUF1232 domain-containing protein [Lysinibacillus sp.]